MKFQFEKTSNKKVIGKKPLTNLYEMNSRSTLIVVIVTANTCSAVLWIVRYFLMVSLPSIKWLWFQSINYLVWYPKSLCSNMYQNSCLSTLKNTPLYVYCLKGGIYLSIFCMSSQLSPVDNVFQSDFFFTWPVMDISLDHEFPSYFERCHFW